MDGRLYPWGNEWEASAVPVPDKGRTMRGPDSVTAHPKGASPFGVMDLAGNMWQWIDEFVDEHSRGGILRGGSFLDPSETRPYPVTGKNRFRRAIHPSGLSLSGVASVNHLRSRSAKSTHRFTATEVRA
jgi:formylglycine-generating enzyme required for sulfatase activity